MRLLSLLVIASLAGAAPAAAGPDDCGTRTPGTLGAAAVMGAPTPLTRDSLVQARIVFVTFPDSPEHTLPSWADSMRHAISDFIPIASRGHQRFDLRIARRTDDSTLAWMAPEPAAVYAASLSGWAVLNRDVLLQIAATAPADWADVKQIFMLHDQCAFNCEDNSTRSRCEDTCPLGGIANTGVTPIPGLGTTDGTTQRFFTKASDPVNFAIQLNFAMHEYGHRLGAGHTPGSDESPPAFVNAGHYDLMRSGMFAGFVREQGLLPYHPLWLSRFDWLPQLTLASDSLDVRLPDVLGVNGLVVEVQPRAGTQSFVLAHAAGTTPYDAKYGRDGLLIWHDRRDAPGVRELAWDLESAAGRRLAGAPDPILGDDPLEASALEPGSAADLFVPPLDVVFGADTNPASGRYASDVAGALETLRSGVSIENLRRDLATSDLLVDVFVTPMQPLLAPRGGEVLLPGATVPITWRVRPRAGIVRVDLERSSDGGANWGTFAANVANTGGFDWHPDVTGDRVRVRVVSRDSSGALGIASSADLTILGTPPELPEAAALRPARPNPSAGPATLALDLPAPAWVVAHVLDLGGRRVRTLAAGMLPAGSHTLTWDGRRDDGGNAPAGVYLVRVRAGSWSAEQRVVRVP